MLHSRISARKHTLTCTGWIKQLSSHTLSPAAPSLFLNGSCSVQQPVTTQANCFGQRPNHTCTPHRQRAALGSVLLHNALAWAGRAVAGHTPPRGFFLGSPRAGHKPGVRQAVGRGLPSPALPKCSPPAPATSPGVTKHSAKLASTNRDAENALPGPQNSKCLGHNVTTPARKNKTTKKETPKKGLAVGPVPGSGSAAHRTAQG